MGRSPCCSKVGLRRGPWSTKEDALLTDYIQLHGEGQWRDLPKNAGLLRCGKSCRLRWMNYLRPGIKRGNISEDEEDLIVRLHSLLGNRWSLIAGRLPGRTDNEIKNHWNTHLLKKLNTAGIIHPNREFSKSKPNNNNNNNNNKKKKNKKKKKSSTITITTKEEEEEEEEEELEHVVEPAKTKVYLPKPMRVSSDFSRTSSYESLISIGTYNSTTSNMSGGGGEGDDHYYNNNNNNNNKVLLWEPLFEAAEDEFEMLSGGYNIILPAPAAADSLDAGDDVGMLDRVYDEYLQLL